MEDIDGIKCICDVAEKKKKSRALYMAAYRARKKAENPVLYNETVNSQKRSYRGKQRIDNWVALYCADGSLYLGEDVEDWTVTSLYFDPPEGISGQEMFERKRLMMIDYGIPFNTVDDIIPVCNNDDKYVIL